MNVLQIEAGLAGRDDLPYLDVGIGDQIRVEIEVLRPKLSRWHWWLDRGRRRTEQTIMVPVLSIALRRWGADRGKDSMPSTVVVPKRVAEIVKGKLRWT